MTRTAPSPAPDQSQSTSKPIRVLLFAPEPAAWASGGGVNVFTNLLKEYLPKTTSVDWFRVGSRPGLIGQVFRALRPIYDAFRLAIRLTARTYDIYHLNPSFDRRSVLRDGLFLLVLRAYRRRQILVFFHGWDSSYYNFVSSSGIGRQIFRYVYGYPERLVVLGSCFSHQLAALGLENSKIAEISTMFEGNLFTDIARTRNDGNLQLLFLSRFTVEKGVYELLGAFRRVSQTDPRLLLVMAGHSPEVARAKGWCVEHNLADKVVFTGYITGKDKAQLLIDSDIFVLPSHREGCPIALLEAMGAGLPVICTPVGGIPDIVEDRVNGLVVPPHDVDALASAIQDLVGDPELRNQIAQKNRQVAWAKYEASVVTERLFGLYPFGR